MGPRGLNLNLQAQLFLGNQESQWALVGMVIGIYHPHTHDGNMLHMLVHMGPKGKYSNIKGLLFLETKVATWL